MTEATTRAVFLDALGTLVELEPPWLHLRGVVPDRVSDETLERGVRAEMAYYKEHAQEGRDEESLADLRERCAAVLSNELSAEVSVEQLVDSVKFRPYADAEPALGDLRERGLKLVVVSNWDSSLALVLERCGLLDLVDEVVTSAGSGASKPDPAIFAAALDRAGCDAPDVIHVGDTTEEDVAGARAAGVRALLIDRDGDGDIVSLAEIVSHLGDDG
jgi:HAD superfamily hydrolase (TIGR01549 family)